VSTIGGWSDVSKAKLAADSEAVPDGVGVPEAFTEAALAGRIQMSSLPVPTGGFSPSAGALPVQRMPVPGFSDGRDDLSQDPDTASEVVLAGVADESEQTWCIDAGGATDAWDPILQGDLEHVP